MKSLKPHEHAYWQLYLQTLPDEQRRMQMNVSAGYAGTLETTDTLLELYLAGKKVAGSSLLEDFLAAGDPLPKVGNRWIYLNGRNQPCCILKTEKIVTHKFKDVPAEIAIAEGEGDLSLSYWKRIHSELYAPFLRSWGVKNIDEATVITEFFSIAYQGLKDN